VFSLLRYHKLKSGIHLHTHIDRYWYLVKWLQLVTSHENPIIDLDFLRH